MTEVRVDNITDAAGTGKPDFEDGFTSEGAALSTLNTHEYSTTEPASPKNGSIWYDSGTIKIYVNDDWYTVNLNASASSATWYGDRAVSAGGQNSVKVNTIDYWSITTQANASDFGDLTLARSWGAATSSDVYGLIMGGYTPTVTNTIDYITIATTGNASDFGDLSTTARGNAATGNGVRGLRGGGNTGSGDTDVIDYVTIDTPGNAIDFGDLNQARQQLVGVSDATYSLFAGGYASGPVTTTNAIEYVTIDTTGNTTDFGDLLTDILRFSAASDTTRGVFAGGYKDTSPAGVINTIQYVTIATPGNSTDFGDLLGNYDRGAGHSDATYANFSGGQIDTVRVNTIQYITIQTTGNASDWADLTAAIEFTAGFAGAAS